MADTGYNWGAWAFVQKSASNWTADDITDTNTETGDAVDLDNKAACEISIWAAEANIGTISGDVTVWILGAVDTSTYEVPGKGNPAAISFTPVQNETIYKRIAVDPAMYGTFKVAVENQSGQTLAITVKYRTATIPVAS